MHCFLFLLLFQTPPMKTDGETKKVTVNELWQKLPDLKPDQKDQLRQITDEYAERIADLEAQRNDKLLAVLNRDQVTKVSEMIAEATQKYRIVLRDKPRPPQIAVLMKVLREQLKMSESDAKARIEKLPGQPLLTDLDKVKAEALLKALAPAGRVAMEKQNQP